MTQRIDKHSTPIDTHPVNFSVLPERCPKCGELLAWINQALQEGFNSPDYVAALRSINNCKTHENLIIAFNLAENQYTGYLSNTGQREIQSRECPYHLDACVKSCPNWTRGRCRHGDLMTAENQPGLIDIN